MTRRIGWYVHHHGRGHLTRLLAVAPHVDAEIACFSSLAEPPGLPANCSWTMLDRDDDPLPRVVGGGDGRDPATADPTAGGMLHWAPLRHPGHRARLAAIVAALAATPVDAFVVDVSAEVALLVRVLGVPPVLVTQPGVRDDPAHRLAFRAATAIVAPWPGDLMRPRHLAPFADRTVFTGGISRFAGRPVGHGRGDSRDVLVLSGGGGASATRADVARAASATGRTWRSLGGDAWTPDPWDDLTRADLVVSWAGQNAIADLAAAGTRAVVVPQPRPFGEQRATARALDRAGLAVTSPRWPDPGRWPALLERAALLRPDWSRWNVDGAAERAARAIERSARR